MRVYKTPEIRNVAVVGTGERQDLPGRRPRVRGRHEQASWISERRHRPHPITRPMKSNASSINLALAVAMDGTRSST